MEGVSRSAPVCVANPARLTFFKAGAGVGGQVPVHVAGRGGERRHASEIHLSLVFLDAGLRYTEVQSNRIFVTVECLYGYKQAIADGIKRIVKP